MNADSVYALEKLNAAFKRLNEATEQAVDDLDRDGTIQRFEFTFELLWKATKVKTKTPAISIMLVVIFLIFIHASLFNHYK